MKKKFSFYKNIIMVAASALTLVAVTFAWFTTSYDMSVNQFNAYITGDAIKVDFYQADENENYQPLSGNIELNSFVPGNYNKYKMVVTTKTADKLAMSFSIVDLPSDIPQDLADSVCIKYTVYQSSKVTAADGSVSYVDLKSIAQSDGYVPISALNDGKIIPSLSLANYQSTNADNFVIYYEIGLSEDAPATIGGLESSLGNIRVGAQRIG